MEMVIRVVDKVNPDDAGLDAMLLKRGDVVDIQADGWNWSGRERTNPAWIIVSVPNMSETEEEEWLESNLIQDAEGKQAVRPGAIPAEGLRRRRKFDFNALSLTAGEKGLVGDNKRATPVIPLVGKNRTQRDQLKQFKTGG